MSVARALRFGARWDAIAFCEGRWWHRDMTGALVGPITRREAYLTAISYMNARELADYDIPRADVEAVASEPVERCLAKMTADTEEK